MNQRTFLGLIHIPGEDELIVRADVSAANSEDESVEDEDESVQDEDSRPGSDHDSDGMENLSTTMDRSIDGINELTASFEHSRIVEEALDEQNPDESVNLEDDDPQETAETSAASVMSNEEESCSKLAFTNWFNKHFERHNDNTFRNKAILNTSSLTRAFNRDTELKIKVDTCKDFLIELIGARKKPFSNPGIYHSNGKSFLQGWTLKDPTFPIPEINI